MNNQEKHNIIASLNKYWTEAHPDCFLEYPDGRKIFRDDLLAYKQDVLLRNVYSRVPEAAQQLPEFKTPRVWPLWLCIGLLAVVELAHVFNV